MAIFNSYVKLPEGNSKWDDKVSTGSAEHQVTRDAFLWFIPGMKKTEVETHSGPSNNILNIHLGISGLEASEPNCGKFGSSSASFLVLTYSNIYIIYIIYIILIYIYIYMSFLQIPCQHIQPLRNPLNWILSPMFRGFVARWGGETLRGQRNLPLGRGQGSGEIGGSDLGGDFSSKYTKCNEDIIGYIYI